MALFRGQRIGAATGFDRTLLSSGMVAPHVCTAVCYTNVRTAGGPLPGFSPEGRRVLPISLVRYRESVSKIEHGDLDNAKVGTIRKGLEVVGGDLVIECVSGEQRLQVG